MHYFEGNSSCKLLLLSITVYLHMLDADADDGVEVLAVYHRRTKCHQTMKQLKMKMNALSMSVLALHRYLRLSVCLYVCHTYNLHCLSYSELHSFGLKLL